MIGLIQRVHEAKVTIDQTTVGDIQHGILLFLGVEKHDDTAKAQRLLERVITYRIFEDDSGRMNRSLVDIKGELLIVSQFTLPADTRKGTRPSFTPAAPPNLGRTLYDEVLTQAQQQVQQQRLAKVASGQFGADMQVHLINDGPVTFWLQV
ncbi:MAG: D-aminoacyl-tRNA deacylase [bacterium]